MRVLPIAAVALSLAASGLAQAADLTAEDMHYLMSEFGIGPDAMAIKELDPEGRAMLHAAINDPSFRDPAGRAFNTGDQLFVVILNCQAHTSPKLDCIRPGGSAAAARGYEVADRSCNSCHLTGTTDAPSFFKLARRPDWNPAMLGQTLAAGHLMSPVSLAPAELDDLAAYLQALR